MEIVFVGTGGIFDLEFGNSAAIVDQGGRLFLIDCGPSVYAKLYRARMAERIDYILLTHLHEDHIGSLSTLILHLNLRASAPRRAVIVYPTEEFRADLETLLQYCLGSPSEFVDFYSLERVEGLGCIETTGMHSPNCRSFAYYFVDGDDLIYYSGDIGDVSVAARFLESRSERNIRVFHEIHYARGPSHSYYSDVYDALKQYNVYGYHVDPRRLPADNKIPIVSSCENLLLNE